MNAEDLRAILSNSLRDANIQSIFSEEKISQQYKEIRNSKNVEEYHQKMMEVICKQNKQYLRILELLESKDVKNYEEGVIKQYLLQLAIVSKMKDDVRGLEEIILSVITEENMIRAIADWMDILTTAIHDIIDREINNAILTAGIKCMLD